MIQIKGLCKNFGDFQALHNINMNIKKGSIYGLVGDNGAGKTTLMKHIMGIYKQDRGLIAIGGKEVYENNEVKQQISYIPDELYFFSQYSIKNMAKFHQKIYKNWNQDRYTKLQKVFNIDENKRIDRLSKGMQKQVAFWLALSSMPKAMVLDEPIDGLDPLMRKRIWKLIMDDVAERRLSVLISSHNLKELENVCDCIGILHKGKMILERDLDELKSDIHKIQVGFKQKSDEVIVDFENEINVLHREKRGSIYILIVKGDRNKIINRLHKYDFPPVIVDLLPLTLEEIFIYELGGMKYEIEAVM